MHNCANQEEIHIGHDGMYEWWVLISFGHTFLFGSYKLSIAHRTKLLFLIAEDVLLLEDEQNVVNNFQLNRTHTIKIFLLSSTNIIPWMVLEIQWTLHLR